MVINIIVSLNIYFSMIKRNTLILSEYYKFCSEFLNVLLQFKKAMTLEFRILRYAF